MKTIIIDNFLSKVECNNLINYYKANEKFSKQWRDVYPLACNVEDIKSKLNVISKEYGAEVDWFEIVKWPIGSKQGLHFDMAKNHTILSSIVYLNDNFDGGHFITKNGISIKPEKGMLTFFNGQKVYHGVKRVLKNDRKTIIFWWRK